MSQVKRQKNQCSKFATWILLGTALSGCVTMGSLSSKRQDLESEKSKWVRSCIAQARQSAEKLGFYSDLKTDLKGSRQPKIEEVQQQLINKAKNYAYRLESRGSQALASLNENNCKPNVFWYWYSYPDCMEKAELDLKKITQQGCSLQEFVAELQQFKLQINEDLDKQKSKEAEEKKYLDRRTAFIAALEKSNATHVLLGLYSGQDGRTCAEQIDGSFICENGAVCEKSAYISAVKEELAGKKPPSYHSYCDRDSAASQNFFFVAKEKMKFSRYEYYGSVIIPVKRGPNSIIINGFGAKMPAASWMQVSPIFDPINKFSLSH